VCPSRFAYRHERVELEDLSLEHSPFVADESIDMQIVVDSPAEQDVRFLGYRLEVIRRWPPSARKVATSQAISQRLTTIARCAMVRPDIADLLNLSCRLLDDSFAADRGAAFATLTPPSHVRLQTGI
jgi:hypothetical protein